MGSIRTSPAAGVAASGLTCSPDGALRRGIDQKPRGEGRRTVRPAWFCILHTTYCILDTRPPCCKSRRRDFPATRPCQRCRWIRTLGIAKPNNAIEGSLTARASPARRHSPRGMHAHCCTLGLVLTDARAWIRGGGDVGVCARSASDRGPRRLASHYDGGWCPSGCPKRHEP